MIYTRTSVSLLLVILGLISVSVQAEVPGVITYQGRVTSNGTNFTGLGQFRFAIIRAGLVPTTLWSQDGKPTPSTIVFVPVTNGLFTVAIGDTNLPGMLNPIPPDIFATPTARLRLWFNDGPTGFAQLEPDQPLTSVGYAMRAANVLDGAITAAQIADGAVGSSDLADGAVITPKLANAAVTTAKLADGSVTPEKIPAGSITGQKIAPNALTSEDIADTLRLRDLQIESVGGLDRVQLAEVANSGVVYMNHGTIGRFLEASGTTSGGFLRLFDAFGGIGPAQTTVELGSSSVGGFARVLQDNASTGVQINGQNGATPGGAILVYRESGLGMTLLGSSSAGQGSLFTMYNGLGNRTVSIDADASGRASVMQLFKSDGTATITLDANSSNEGRITTQVLEITGGSDLSENFEIQTLDAKPGMIVSIDPSHPGELSVSARAYDRTVAGVVSGAGGVKPGLLMGQKNSKADGKHPVALSGRVYCFVDASNGGIEPGDLITTSATPGHGMKVSDSVRAQGAVIGKAMTGLSSGKGLVLILVSLQ